MDNIKIINGDMFKSTCEAWSNTCNAKGAAGKGIAKEFANRYKMNLHAYETVCKGGACKGGDVFLFHNFSNPKYILNCFTKEHWKNPSKYEWIEKCIKTIGGCVLHNQIKSVAIPGLGCGCGGLAWDRVLSMLEDEFRLPQYNDILVELYEPR